MMSYKRKSKHCSKRKKKFRIFSFIGQYKCTLQLNIERHKYRKKLAIWFPKINFLEIYVEHDGHNCSFVSNETYK